MIPCKEKCISIKDDIKQMIELHKKLMNWEIDSNERSRNRLALLAKRHEKTHEINDCLTKIRKLKKKAIETLAAECKSFDFNLEEECYRVNFHVNNQGIPWRKGPTSIFTHRITIRKVQP